MLVRFKMLSSPLLPLTNPFWFLSTTASTAGMMASATIAAISLLSTLFRVMGRVRATSVESSLGKTHRSPLLKEGGGGYLRPSP